ncbi:MAG TPA: thioredoxin domain-containing protein, partial [Bacteroidia bacterium]|nr:thioredoxin domain-containing protein [Bacteroidia bacterium]
GEEALRKAKEENRLMLVSIGYSACHWCHVMERESFEDEKVARIMNDHFVCIKIDREERPDIDQVYMNAVQLMTSHGGWPLNCFTLPDGRPLYGGTYFPKEKWVDTLFALADLWKNDAEKCMQYAQELTQGVKHSELPVADESAPAIAGNILGLSVEQWSLRFDNSEGGPSRAPKFPLPNNYLFLLRQAFFTQSEKIKKHVLLTLDKMMMGGIYDQAGGGFARYSTDMLWKVPHFEKMLYDNAQLISLYAEAFRWTKNEAYKNVVHETAEFAERELSSPSGAFYSALDADSEGEEGKFYVWEREEMEKLLGEDFGLAADYFSLGNLSGGKSGMAYWEDGKYILLRRESDEAFARKRHMEVTALQKKISGIKNVLMAQRAKRIRPGLDDKTLASWNALMLRGLVDAYQMEGEEKFLLRAKKNAEFLLREMLRMEDGKVTGMWHSWKNGRATVNAFLEDYAFVTDAFIALYQAQFEEKWLMLAIALCEYACAHFGHEGSPLFCFTSDEDPALIARKMEISDNVIPASNSAMARNLFYLGHYTGRTEWIARAEQMLALVQKEIVAYGAGYSNWMILQQHFVFPFREIAIVGNAVDKTGAAFRKHYLPNQIFAGSTGNSTLPLTANRFIEGRTLIYVCENNTCGLPVAAAEEALKNIPGYAG